MQRDPLRWLRILAAVEPATVVILFANLATVNVQAVASLVGPAHGCAYLVIVVSTLRRPGAGTATKLLAFVPGVGGMLVARRLTSADTRGTIPPS